MDTVLLLLSVCASALLIGFAWYAAKRDLTAAAARAQSPALRELSEMRETVEELISILDQKASDIETRLTAHFERLSELEATLASAKTFVAESRLNDIPVNAPEPAEPSTMDRAVELLAQGTDARTVSQMTGLTVAEIETAARMKELRAGRR